MKTEKPFIVHDLDTGSKLEYEKLDDIPKAHRWAFDHILDQDCESISCGTTVYQLKGPIADFITGRL